MNDSMRAVIVTRVSTEKQEEGTSLAAQLVACQKCAKDINAAVVGYYEEIVSGALYQARPDMQQALKDIEEKRANCLIVAKLDRAGRDVDNLRDIKRRVEKAGGRLIFADGLVFQQGAVGDLLFTQLSGFAEFERALIRERTSRGSIERAKSGIMPTRHFRPFGYRFEAGRYEIVEDEAHWARQIFEHYAGDTSLHGVCRFLQENQVATLRGAALWLPGTVRNMILNPVYKGQAAYGKNRAQTDEGRVANGLKHRYFVPRDKSEWIYIDCPAIVSSELWEQCQVILQEGRSRKAGNPATRHLLTGMLRCPRCGRAMSFNTRTYRTSAGKPRLQPLTIKTYRCPYSFRDRGVGGPGSKCDGVSFRADQLEALTIKGLLEIAQRPEILKNAVIAYREGANTSAKTEQSLNRINKELAKLQTKELSTAESQIEARTEGRDDTIYRTLLGRYAEQRLHLQEQKKAWETQLSNLPSPSHAFDFPNMFAEDLKMALQSTAEPVHETNQLLLQVIKSVMPYSENSLEVRLKGPNPSLDFVCRVGDRPTEVTLQSAVVVPKLQS